MAMYNCCTYAKYKKYTYIALKIVPRMNERHLVYFNINLLPTITGDSIRIKSGSFWTGTCVTTLCVGAVGKRRAGTVESTLIHI